MKKLILSLVLAAITLPAMALSTNQQVKITNALATLEAYGIDPTVVSDNVSDTINLSYSYLENGNANWGKDFAKALINRNDPAIPTGGLIVHRGEVGEQNWIYQSFDYTNDRGGNVLFYDASVSGTYDSFAVVKITGQTGCDKYKIGKSYYCWNANVKEALEIEYDNFWADKESRGIFQEGVLASDALSSLVSDKIIGKAQNLKETIKALSYQTATAEISKSMSQNCTSTEGAVTSIGICYRIGEQYLDLSSNLTTIVQSNDGYLVEGANYGTNDGFYAYLEHRTDTAGITSAVYQKIASNGQRTGDVRTANSFQYLGGTTTKKTLLDTYSTSLSDITNIADAYGDLASGETMGSFSGEHGGNTMTFEETSAGVWTSTSGLVGTFSQTTVDAIAAGADMLVHYGQGWSLVEISDGVWKDSNGSVTNDTKADSLTWGWTRENVSPTTYDSGTDEWTIGELFSI